MRSPARVEDVRVGEEVGEPGAGCEAEGGEGEEEAARGGGLELHVVFEVGLGEVVTVGALV